MKTVLAVDDDVAFLFWLARTLESTNFRVVPATDVLEAEAIMAELGLEPDLVIINPALSRGDEYIAVLRRTHPSLVVLAALEESTPDAIVRSVSADRVERKPTGLTGIAPDDAQTLHTWRAEWLYAIRMALMGRSTSAD